MANIPSQTAHVHKNEVHLAGILTRDPEIKYTSSGKTVAKLSIQTKYKDWSEYHRVVAWEDLAEKAAKFQKGEFVKVVGRLQTRTWDDKQSGLKKYSTEIVAFQVVIPSEEPDPLTPDQTKSGTQAARAILSPAKGASDDIPF
jgi:single stranded DNA-binding protein